ncbi:hypothetical protein J4E93_005250 [Alternaria ventricosa]|uniref:uncharacterized protein n=1 Tax=Alternaria ventricosa TaxID=1187951 RepID=UPI0020C58383|nr:uncharacterized protein J4E93_005250 [Alternaria ventricosa]KAI4645673.1 hypothetical protein J4E93_005250 [Alternaria ventricosa]
MAGLSITSALLSPINKLRGKSNPYQKQYTAPKPPAPNTEFPVSARQAANRNPVTGTQQQPTHPEPPHTDLLAEARQAAGRNPVTGRPQPVVNSKKGKKGKKQKMMSLEQQQQAAEEQKAAFLAWAKKHPREGGRPYESYEAFVQEMVAKRTGCVEQRMGVGYYAPERRVGEYYAGGVGE